MEEHKEITTEAARQIIERSEQEQLAAFIEEINEVQERHRYRLTAVARIQDGLIVADIGAVAVQSTGNNAGRNNSA